MLNIMIFSPEQKEEYKQIIRRVLTLSPSISLREIQKRLKEAQSPVELSLPYIMEVTREIRTERIREIEQETKEEIFAQVKDLVEFINGQLRAIAQEEKLVYMKTKDGVPVEKAETRIFAQNNRIKALNSMIDNTIKLVNLKMDLGIIDRKLGTMDVEIIDYMSALKKIRNGDFTTKLDDLPALNGAVQETK